MHYYFHNLRDIIKLFLLTTLEAGVCVSKWRVLDAAPHYAVVEGRDVVQKTSSFLPYQQLSSDKVCVVLVSLIMHVARHGCFVWSCHQVDQL